jgi:uncharacterized protein YxjI
MEELKECNKFIVRQQVSAQEAVMESFDLEQENTYIVSDDIGRELFFAQEEAAHGFLFKSFLNSARPFTISVLPNGPKHGIRVTRPFRFYFHEASVALLDGREIGTVKKKFSFLRRVYSVSERSNREAFRIVGPLLKPWTFEIYHGQRRIGAIRKNWTGLLKEALTQADNFTVEFPQEIHVAHKLLLLGIVFLIDFVHFEKGPSDS